MGFGIAWFSLASMLLPAVAITPWTAAAGLTLPAVLAARFLVGFGEGECAWGGFCRPRPSLPLVAERLSRTEVSAGC